MKKKITIKREQFDIINHLVQHEHLSYEDAVTLLNNTQLIQ